MVIAGRMLIITILLVPLMTLSQDISKFTEGESFKITGTVGISTVFFSVDGRDSNRKPFTWLLRGNPVLSFKGMDIPISIIVSEQERDFRQPFNRFGFSPYYKWARLHLGYQNLQFSKYSLAGHAMVGAGFELNPGKIRLGMMYGRLLKAVQPNTLIEDSEFLAIPSFERNGRVFKVGYGSQDNYIDVILLSAGDELASIDSIPTEYGIQPADNGVISLVTHQRMGNHFNLHIEYAQSSYTNDTRTEIDTDHEGLFSVVSFLNDSKSSTEVSTALDAELDFSYKSIGTRFRFERVSPNFRSMGAYFFLSDVQKITIEPRLAFWQNKITINTSLGFQKNNLSNQKSLQTDRSIGAVRINARLTNNYSINGHFTNYGVTQKEGFISAADDNLISQVTSNWGINQNYQITGTTFMHNAMMSYQKQQLSDDNPNTSAFTDYNNNTLFVNYSFSYLPKRLGANISYTHSKFTNQSLETVFKGPNLSVNASFIKNKVRLSAGQSFLSNISNDELQRRINKTTFRATYKLTKSQRFSFRMYYNKSNSYISTITPFEETKIDLQYVYQFR